MTKQHWDTLTNFFLVLSPVLLIAFFVYYAIGWATVPEMREASRVYRQTMWPYSRWVLAPLASLVMLIICSNKWRNA